MLADAQIARTLRFVKMNHSRIATRNVMLYSPMRAKGIMHQAVSSIKHKSIWACPRVRAKKALPGGPGSPFR